MPSPFQMGGATVFLGSRERCVPSIFYKKTGTAMGILDQIGLRGMEDTPPAPPKASFSYGPDFGAHVMPLLPNWTERVALNGIIPFLSGQG